MALTGPNSCWSCSYLLSHHKTNRFMGSPTLFMTCNVWSKVKLGSSLRVKASSSRGEEEQDPGNGFSKEDWSYVLKLGAGSVAGSAVIKYGSVVFPEITRPNIFLALFMISTPVIVAIVLLTKQSRW